MKFHEIATFFPSRRGLLFPVLLILGALAFGCPKPSPDLSSSPSSDPARFTSQWKALLTGQKYEEARQLCEPAVDDPAQQVEALICLANVETGLGRHETVGVNVMNLGLIPGESGSGNLTADDVYPEVVWDPAHLEAALGYLDRALEVDPSRKDVWKGKAFILQDAGKHQELLAHLGRMAKECPGVVREDLSGYGENYVRADRLDRARDVYQLLTEIYPRDFIVWCDYGAVIGRMGELEQAREILLKAHTLGEDHILLSNLANINIFLERYDEALPYLQTAVQKNPRNQDDQVRLLLTTLVIDPDHAHRLARDLGGPGFPEVNDLKQMIERDVSSDYALQLGLNYMGAQVWESALLLFQLAREVPKTDYYRAAVYHELSYRPGAIKYLKSFLERMGPEDEALRANAEMNLGEEYLRGDDLKSSETHLQRSIDLGEHSSRVYFLLGVNYYRQDNKPAAEKAFRQAIKIDDDKQMVGWSKYYLEQMKKEGPS